VHLFGFIIKKRLEKFLLSNFTVKASNNPIENISLKPCFCYIFTYCRWTALSYVC